MKLPAIARSEQWAVNHFTATKAVIEGSHLVLSSGDHAEIYLNADRIFPDASRMAYFYDFWKDCFFSSSSPERHPEVVVGPATGGVYLIGGLSQRLIAQGIYVQAVWADKDGKQFALERSRFASTVRGKRVLVVEDVMTTAKSIKKTIKAVRQAGGEVVGVACMVNQTRAVTVRSLDVPVLHVAWQLDVKNYSSKNCPFCAENRPIVTNIGHGAEFQEKNPKYAGGYEELMFDD